MTGSGKRAVVSTRNSHMDTAALLEKHKHDLENLKLTTQPFKTLKLFVLAVFSHIRQSISYLLAKGGWLMLLCTLLVTTGILLVTIDGPHVQHLEELSEYFGFGLWWIALGVASSIGLGSGLHTFVLYLGPHISFFTLKAMECGRVDLKSAPYDTIKLRRGASWHDKPCSEFGPPVFTTYAGAKMPLSSILPQVQIEAILWGLGTALGELPPYFISRAARLSGGEFDAIETLDISSAEANGIFATHINQIKRWFLSHTQHLNFFTILILASVPNPLFDLAGIMCGRFGIPFLEFFLATLVGKAIIKTHIQTAFLISLCNNQLIDWMENELIWLLGFIPGLASGLPGLTAKLRSTKEKYLRDPHQANTKVTRWGLSFASVWNSLVWLVLLNFFGQIINSTAQSYLTKQQEEELAALRKKTSVSKHSD